MTVKELVSLLLLVLGRRLLGLLLKGLDEVVHELGGNKEEARRRVEGEAHVADDADLVLGGLVIHGGNGGEGEVGEGLRGRGEEGEGRRENVKGTSQTASSLVCCISKRGRNSSF